MKALDVAWARWQLGGEVKVWQCGCRRIIEVDTATNRRVATCKAHRRHVGVELHPWAPM